MLLGTRSRNSHLRRPVRAVSHLFVIHAVITRNIELTNLSRSVSQLSILLLDAENQNIAGHSDWREVDHRINIQNLGEAFVQLRKIKRIVVFYNVAVLLLITTWCISFRHIWCRKAFGRNAFYENLWRINVSLLSAYVLGDFCAMHGITSTVPKLLILAEAILFVQIVL